MRCRWSLFAIALALAALSAASAQPPVEPKDGKYVVPLTVDAVGPARPALKYRLLPELREMRPGNQIPAFYKCFFEQSYLFHNKESTDKQKQWMEAPLKDLAGERELVNYGGSAYKQAHYAARLDAVNWELTNQAKTEGVMLLLPDVQSMRMLAAVLKVRVRGEIACGEFDNAIQTLQTMFALARTFNEHPTLIGHLVGTALAMVAFGAVEEFVQQPGAPNLFWPLIDLPAPLLDMRKGREGEKLFLTREYDVLRKAVPAADADLAALLKNLDALAEGDKNLGVPSAWYAKRAKDAAVLTAAAEHLKTFGHTPADLAKLSPLQLVLMDDFAQYQVDLDEFLKWTNVPYWQIPVDLGQQKRPGPFGALLPAYMKVTHAKARAHQCASLLTVAEGVRAHAADNGGKLPEKLDAVKLPLPPDPVTGKPFVYELRGATAVIRGTPAPGREQEPAFNRVYEVTVRKR
ncbi:MAG: hypothetical protein J0I06_26185 [Planctomycetes bacterium]|nr:hypothetical protein [Planctomycetota bacterium]